MQNATNDNRPAQVTTGNVMKELGFSAQEIREAEIKHGLWAPIRAEMESRRLTQRQLARLLKIHQPDASLLARGQITRFSISRLMQFADDLGLAVSLTVRPKPAGMARIPLRKANRKAAKARPAARRTASVARSASLAGSS